MHDFVVSHFDHVRVACIAGVASVSQRSFSRADSAQCLSCGAALSMPAQAERELGEEAERPLEGVLRSQSMVIIGDGETHPHRWSIL